MEKRRVKIENPEEIKERLKSEKNYNIKVKLIFLNILVSNEKMEVKDVCDLCGIAVPTGYLWIRKWNESGYEGLKDKEGKKGRPQKISEEELEKLKNYLKSKAYWTTKEVLILIKEKFGVDYSEDQVVRILRNKMGMKFSKPYTKDYRRPKNAEQILENQLELTFSVLKNKGIKPEEIAIGFIDETSPQNTANTVRVWSFEKITIEKNTNRLKTNTIGFYAIRGKSVEGFLNNAKAETIAGFFEKIKEKNERYKTIIAVIDNFPSHKSEIVRKKARELGIYLVYLPPYSPDLNPIEYIWKSIKRELSLVLIKGIEEMKSLIKKSWDELSNRLTFAKRWIEKFLRGKAEFYNLFCG